MRHYWAWIGSLTIFFFFFFFNQALKRNTTVVFYAGDIGKICPHQAHVKRIGNFVTCMFFYCAGILVVRKFRGTFLTNDIQSTVPGFKHVEICFSHLDSAKWRNLYPPECNLVCRRKRVEVLTAIKRKKKNNNKKSLLKTRLLLWEPKVSLCVWERVCELKSLNHFTIY